MGQRVGIFLFHSLTKDMLRYGDLYYSEPLREKNRASHDRTWVVMTTIESFGTEANASLESS